jgi:hypothetical protein
LAARPWRAVAFLVVLPAAGFALGAFGLVVVAFASVSTVGGWVFGRFPLQAGIKVVWQSAIVGDVPDEAVEAGFA